MRKKITITAMSLLTALFLLPINGFAYTINDEYNLAPNQGDSRLAIPNKIILHETGIDAPARNVAANMKNNYNGSNPYTTDVIGDGGIVYRVGEQGYVSWGAGNANPYAPVQIELQRTYDKALFEKNYRAYIEYTRDSAKKYGIPLTLDQGTSLFTKGIISHLWVTNYVWGNHTDPYGYLSQMGVSKEKLAYDLAHGFTDENPTTSDDKPVIDPTRAGAANPTLTDGTNYAHIDQFGEIENANLHVAGWHIANYKYEYIFIMDYNTGKELARVRADGIYRPDVNQTYGTYGNVGYHVSFNMRNFPNKKVYVMMRATNDPEGNTKGGAQDFHDKRWYLNIPKR
ncbi:MULTISPECIES: peptidoglycan recognition protein family protein [Enterococcus]|uniref:peptidoglycan recognition protein family protein n=1 Tax=Enterococcus TaxID=1350 RepID=UPI000B3EBC9A|nr:peptidoglycan recognition family protein [Enterococcus faecium]MDQ8552250.1 peptidoglycan recognition family protein [Enterococcus faecium]MDV4991603.1 peptidoglycan recognition protein family protein [Enterococcus faecium]NTM15115.1 N-acetylmuramoyl-L-alanine amidase [Enterococcus faecium]OUZ21810.1 N-acetylmuramoyl-L-alanine amidase [Enterococcus faecium]HAQ4401928.1 N-acetylmuramoyl-L-alanine amidase [Enterococcus faecium]